MLRVVMICGLVGAISARPFAKYYLDMSHQYNSETIYWPIGQLARFNLTMYKEMVPGTNVQQAQGDISAGEHGGTHMDSPYHFYAKGRKIGQIPLDKLRAPAAVIDIREQVNANNDYMATLNDFELWENAHGSLPEDAIVLVCTGWDKHWPDWNKIYGTDDLTDIMTMHFPGVSPELTRWLVDNRKLVGLGIDTPTPDGAATIMTLEVHIITAANDIYLLENVKGACDIPQHGATLLVLPQKIEYGSGAPTRVVATWGDEAYHMTDAAPGDHVTQLGVLAFALACASVF